MRNDRETQRLIRLLREYQPPATDPERRKAAIQSAQLLLGKQDLLPEKSWFARLWEQAGYISPFTWLLQGIAALLAVWAGAYNPGGFGLNLIALTMPLFGVITFTELLRSYRQGMWELEQSCRYNLRQLLIMKLTVFGMADLALLLLLAFICADSPQGLLSLLYLMMVPFLLSNSLYLTALHLVRRCSGYVLLTLGLGVDIGIVYMEELLYGRTHGSWLLPQSMSVWAASAAVVSLALFIGMIGLFLRDIKKEEMTRWSLESID